MMQTKISQVLMEMVMEEVCVMVIVMIQMKPFPM